MKNLKVTTTILAMTFLNLMTVSCKENKKESTDTMHSEMSMDGHNDDANAKIDHDAMTSSNSKMMNSQQSSQTKAVLASYMAVKDALVADNKTSAATTGKHLESVLNSFEVSDYTAEQQAELNHIIDDAKEHAEHISKSEIDHQREHFKMLSKDMLDMMAITGAGDTVYELFCPMYDKGSSWLSMSKDIKNPFYGSKMLTCGSVKKQIN